MKTRDYYFDLPEELIAQEPAEKRGSSRLLVLNRKEETLSHNSIEDLIKLIPEDSVIVLNNSKVRKARMFGQAAETGGQVEFLFLDNLGDCQWKVMVSKSKKQKPGKVFSFPENYRGTITGCDGSLRIIQFDRPLDESFFEKYGHIPLPPYIKREDKESDSRRYQTVYSDRIGSAAAPTAGLHFTEELLEALKTKGCSIVTVTLHVGLGTFLPIRSEDIKEHKMHEEQYEISEGAARIINGALKTGRNIVAVGTTVVRTLESACSGGEVKAGKDSTEIYIYPGYQFKVVKTLLTNFHTPESTLLLLVSAFASKDLIDRAYKEAIKKQYRFFSYGDAMLIL